MHLDATLDGFAEQHPRSLRGAVDHLAQVEALGSQRHLAGAQACRVEEGLEHLGEPVGLIDDRFESRLRCRRVAAIDLSLRHLRRRTHHRDRIAQIMGCHGHELFCFRSTQLRLHFDPLLHLAEPSNDYRGAPSVTALALGPQVMGQEVA